MLSGWFSLMTRLVQPNDCSAFTCLTRTYIILNYLYLNEMSWLRGDDHDMTMRKVKQQVDGLSSVDQHQALAC